MNYIIVFVGIRLFGMADFIMCFFGNYNNNTIKSDQQTNQVNINIIKFFGS